MRSRHRWSRTGVRPLFERGRGSSSGRICNHNSSGTGIRRLPGQPLRRLQPPRFEYEVYERLKLIQVLGQPLGHLNQRNIAVGASDESTIVWAFPLCGSSHRWRMPVWPGPWELGSWWPRFGEHSKNHLAAVLHLPAVPRVPPDITTNLNPMHTILTVTYILQVLNSNARVKLTPTQISN